MKKFATEFVLVEAAIGVIAVFAALTELWGLFAAMVFISVYPALLFLVVGVWVGAIGVDRLESMMGEEEPTHPRPEAPAQTDANSDPTP